jgi:drug/metabolite transporter (DMT)-like permease
VHALTADTSLGGRLASHHAPVWLLAAWMVALGTIAPFFLLVSALRHVTATTAGIVAMLEPVVGALVGWLWLEESLDAVQLVGAAVVLAAVGIAQSAR